MADKRKPTISELVANSELMTAAIRQGVREALLSHARAGNSVPIADNGHVVWLSPAEIYQRLEAIAPSSGGESS